VVFNLTYLSVHPGYRRIDSSAKNKDKTTKRALFCNKCNISCLFLDKNPFRGFAWDYFLAWSSDFLESRWLPGNSKVETKL